MKIIFEEWQDGEEECITIKCRNLTPELMDLINTLKTPDTLITYIDNEIHRVSVSTIYYVETVDNKTFVYGKNNIYESKQKLYELENILPKHDFLRISKSVIVNMNKIKILVPALSGRLEAVLLNNEKVIISRQYVSKLKKRLGI